MLRTNYKSVLLFPLILIILSSCLGGGGEDLAYTNPEWRESVVYDITFPLSQPVTLRVGLDGSTGDPGVSAVQWLEERTGITLEFVSLTSSPGDVLLGEMMREGDLPDIVPEGRLGMVHSATQELLVDYLEFPALTPYFNGVLERFDDFRSSMLAKTTPDGKLFTLGSYDPGRLVYDGVLAYRADLFEKHGLSYGTIDDLVESFFRLKTLYPDSYPLGGTFDSLLSHFPSWFGSGLDPKHLVYYDVEARKWVMGPFEDEFRRAIKALSELALAGVIPMDIYMLKASDVRRYLSTGLIFAAPYSGFTGPGFASTEDGYGVLGSDGEWDGEGMWIAPMELPKTSAGKRARYSTSLHSASGKGWQVYNQSDHVGEAIALLDFLFSDEAAENIALGPEGSAWIFDAESISIKPEYLKEYRSGWIQGFQDSLSASGIAFGSPLVGLGIDYLGLFGLPEIDRLIFYLSHDMQRNRPGIDIQYQPGVRIPEVDEFVSERASLTVSLRAFVENEIALILSGQKPFSDFDKFLDKLDNAGAQKLLDLYNTWCVQVDTRLLPGAE
ncbi:MAG: extracellular solute-binding protein [Spirochaetales bacterium]|jgi:ABC-type glycerol-3-phosphate transport system substrate-binding protein|nr:extracellular solute-binding protein [Spirochaetales bacterium]